MIFGGMQKLTLLDYPDKTACTLFTRGCNFKCPFCHNAALIEVTNTTPVLDSREILAFLRNRQRLLDGVCISGGEPLLHQGLAKFIGEVKALGLLVKLDTNGSMPHRLIELVREGLVDYVAMDIKNRPEKYAETIGFLEYDLEPVKQSVAFLLKGTVAYEFRTTVVRELHTLDDLMAVASWLLGARKYYLQGFIDSGNVLAGGLSGYSGAEMRALLMRLKTVLPCTELRGT